MDNKKSLTKSSFSYVDMMLIITAIIWGSNPTIVKLGIRDMDPFAYNIGRCIVATATGWIALLIREKDWRLEKQDILPVLGIGLIGNFLNQVAFMMGIQRSTAGNSALIMAALPIIVALINIIFKLEAVSKKAKIGIGVSSMGIILVLLGTGNKISLMDQYFLGNMIMLFGVTTWAVYTILNKRFTEKYSALKIATYGVTVGLIAMLLFWSKSFIDHPWSLTTKEGYLGIIYSGAFSMTLGTTFWNIGLQKVGSTKTSLYNNITPIVSVALGVFLLNETLKLSQGLGAALIIGGLALTRISNKPITIGMPVCCKEESNL